MEEKLTQAIEVLSNIRQEIGRVIIGQSKAVTQALIVVLSGEHALIEGVPGVGKTLLVRTMAAVLGSDFARIQFTPDLMPSDITGINVFNMKLKEFTLVKGPVFTSFLLADEINRAPAKTQSALLQAMQERQVTIDRETHHLSPNFTVFATQNPVEFEGTYPLPEAQKDRFMMKIVMDFPGEDEEMELARRTLQFAEPAKLVDENKLSVKASPADLPNLRRCLQLLTVRPELVEYMVSIIRQSREHPAVLLGASPRALQQFVRASLAQALLEGRDFLIPDDIKTVAYPLLSHRLVMKPEFEIEGVAMEQIIAEILTTTVVPR